PEDAPNRSFYHKDGGGDKNVWKGFSTLSPYGSVFIILSCLSILSLELRAHTLFVISPFVIFIAFFIAEKYARRIVFSTAALLFIVSIFQTTIIDTTSQDSTSTEPKITTTTEYSFIILLILIVSR